MHFSTKRVVSLKSFASVVSRTVQFAIHAMAIICCRSLKFGTQIYQSTAQGKF